LNKRQLYLYSILIGILAGMIGIISVYLFYSAEISESYATIKDAWSVSIIIFIRIGIISCMAFYVLRQWFNQEEQYLSDIPFLFGLFFIILIFGKLLDLLYNLTYFTLNSDEVFILIKVRFFVAILTLLSMIYLSIGMILYYLSLKERYKKYGNKQLRKEATLKILTIIIALEAVAIILAPNTTVIGILLPCFVLPSLATIVWLFAFAYKNQRLSQVHPLIIAIGFGAFLVSNILRPVAQNVLGESATYVITVEIVDILIFIIIFAGLIVKVNYRIE